MAKITLQEGVITSELTIERLTEIEYELRRLNAEKMEISRQINFVDLSKEETQFLSSDNYDLMKIRADGLYKYKGFYLDSQYSWEIIKDDKRELVLLPFKK